MDNSKIDLTTIWQQQKVVQPNIDELLNKLKLFKKNNVRKMIVSNILLIATCVFIIFIWYRFQPQYLSTKIGIVLVILAMAIYLFTYNKQLPIFKSIDGTQTISSYLKSLTVLKAKQKYIQTTLVSLYFMMLSTGVCLYMYEYTSRMTMYWAMVAYGVTLAWLGFNWLYIRPITIRKQQTKLDELMNRLEALNKQLDEK